MNILDPFSKLNVMINKESKMVPTTEECFLLLKKFQVPGHVIAHNRRVHGVALYLCRLLNRHGERLDQAQVEAGSLLHDIAKVRTLETGGNHAQVGARLLWELGFPEVAEIVRQHVVLDTGTDHGRITEAEVVHYADKRVKHTTIVPLGERFQDLKRRYGKSPEAMAWLEDLERRSLLLEERLFQKIPVLPEALSEVVE
jgi:putative nucleotidyltransferase with HDIG domain